MDLVHMATCSIRWDIVWSTESNKSSPVEFDGFGTHGYMLCSVEYWIQQKQPNQEVDFGGFGVKM